MRALKITVIVVLFAAVVVMATLSWLVRSEQGSRWLLQQGLEFSPVTIEARGISGTLADGLGVDRLFIALPAAEIRAEDIVFSWSPSRLLSGVVDINSARIAELGIDILETESSGESIEDKLFWLQIPLHIYIESGRLDRLRIDKAEFDDLGPLLKAGLDALGLRGQNIDVDFKVPEQVHLGYYQDLTKDWSFTLDAMWINMSQFGINHVSVDSASVSLDGSFKDTWLFSAGLRYQYRPDLAFSVGGLYMTSPTTDARRTIALPVDRVIAVGAGRVDDLRDLRDREAHAGLLDDLQSGLMDCLDISCGEYVQA